MNNAYTPEQIANITMNNPVNSANFLATIMFIDEINQINSEWKKAKTGEEKAKYEKEAMEAFEKWSAKLQ